MKKCFVIMPFGGDDPALKKKFDGVFKGIIKPAVIDAGYEPVREDISATPGNIPSSIVRKLAECEMAIVDMTNLNPNVFYELGIRHVFSKSSTVLLISKGERIPFDTASHRVIQYTNELDTLDDIHEKIVQAIRLREEQSTTSDNIVHDTYSELPVDLLGTLKKETISQRLKEQADQITALLNQKRKYEEILKKHGLLGQANSSLEQYSAKELFTQARFAMQKSGKSVRLRLRQLVANGEIDEFVDYLEQSIEAGYLDENDYIQIADLCDQLDSLPLKLAVLESARLVFDSEDIIRNLADVYSEMPDPSKKLQGVSLIERLIGVTEDQGVYQVSGLQHATQNNLAALFNVYSRTKLYSRAVEVSSSLEAQNCPHTSMILRHKASALDDLNKDESAEAAYKELLKLEYYDDTNHAFYASYLTKKGKIVEAYQEREIAVRLDPRDSNRFFQMGVFILNEQYIRKDDNTICKEHNHSVVMSNAIAFFVYALQLNYMNDELRHSIGDILYRRNEIELANQVLSKQPVDMSLLDVFSLSYVLEHHIEP